jgi:signal transduction histidine kinase
VATWRAAPRSASSFPLRCAIWRPARTRSTSTGRSCTWRCTATAASITTFQNALLTLLAVAFLALVGLSVWLSGVLSRQVSGLAGRVAHLDPADGHAPLEAHYRDREVRTLARAFDEYARRVNTLVAREKEFTANVSHELRTPLTTIKTGCELLAQDPGLAERSRSRVRAIGASADSIAELIDALLLLGREAPAGNGDAVDLTELAAEVAAPLRAAIEAKGLRLAIDVPAGTALRVNRAALQLTLANLLRNALTYTDRGEIRVRYADGVLAVSDTGVGIAPENHERVFREFERIRHRDQRNTGAGLGLSLVRRIVELHGGEVSIDSAPGRGTTVTVAIPALAAESRAPAA